jgi:signal transduction histidine kinase
VLIEDSASSQREDGIAIATRAIFHNVTIRRPTEETLKSAIEMAESATATKSKSLATASHDLGQPLQSIGLYVPVLNRQESQTGTGRK